MIMIENGMYHGREYDEIEDFLEEVATDHPDIIDDWLDGMDNIDFGWMEFSVSTIFNALFKAGKIDWYNDVVSVWIDDEVCFIEQELSFPKNLDEDGYYRYAWYDWTIVRIPDEE